MFRAALQRPALTGSVPFMRTVLTLTLLLALAACHRDPTSPIAERGRPAKPAAPVSNQPGHPELAAGLAAYTAGDHERALKFFQEAAEKGVADAQFYTGLMHAEGQGVARSYAEAAKWYEKAAEQNQPDALFALAKLYVIGGGVAPDSAKAIELFKRAEEAYPPSELRDQVAEQRLALEAVLKESQTAQAATAGEAAKNSP
jgi:TPR repeat protein